MCGSLSGTCCTLLFQPLDLVKTRLQTLQSGVQPGSVHIQHGVQSGWMSIKWTVFCASGRVGLAWSRSLWVCCGRRSSWDCGEAFRLWASHLIWYETSVMFLFVWLCSVFLSPQSFVRCIPGVGIYFSTYFTLKQHFFTDGAPGPLQSILLGAGARCVAGVCMLPITVIKTRFEVCKDLIIWLIEDALNLSKVTKTFIIKAVLLNSNNPEK